VDVRSFSRKRFPTNGRHYHGEAGDVADIAPARADENMWPKVKSDPGKHDQPSNSPRKPLPSLAPEGLAGCDSSSPAAATPSSRAHVQARGGADRAYGCGPDVFSFKLKRRPIRER